MSLNGLPSAPRPLPEAVIGRHDQAFLGVDASALAAAVVGTLRELLVLDKDLRVVLASRAFFKKFEMDGSDVQGRSISALGEGQWNIQATTMRHR